MTEQLMTSYDDGESYSAGDGGPALAGNNWLTDLPPAMIAAGLNVRLWPGWEMRARSSGGLEAIRGVVIHHTASSTTTDNDCGYMYDNAGDRPIGNLYVARDGEVILGAAGAANCQGKGGPVTGSQGTVPRDDGNRYLIAVEAGNNGTGEPWPAAQLDAMVALVATVVELYGLTPDDIWTHAGWCEPSTPGRKIDPAGPTPSRPALGGTTGAATWSTDAFRAAVLDQLDRPVPPEPPEPPTDPTEPTEPWPPYHPPSDWGLFPIDVPRTGAPGKPTQREGSLSSHTHYLQSVIHHYAGGDIVIDSQFGPQTARRVRDVQRVFGFPDAYIDAIVGWSPSAPQWATWPLFDYLVALNG